MSLDLILEKKSALLTGEKISEEEAEKLRKAFPSNLVPSWFINLLLKFALQDVRFELDEEDDQSGMGIEFRWMTPDHMIKEAFEYYPGMSVVKLGYLPIGDCMIGSGDPYFLNMKNGSDDPPLVRIPHDFVQEDDSYPEEEIEIVYDSLSSFFEKAKIE